MKGLTGEQAEQRKKSGLQNLPVEAPSKSVGEIVAGNVFTFFNFIFAVLAVCLILVGRYKQMLFLVAVAVNAAIGVVQQIRSKREVDRLSLLSEAGYPVIRDGEEQILVSEELVQDDLVCFRAGAQIPADAVLEEGEARVSEALITGEADAVYKKPGDELRSGSFLLSGRCLARLTHVGAESYVSKLTIEARKKGFGKKSEMMEALDKILHVIAVLLIPMGLFLFWKQHWIMELDISESTVAVIAALVGMIPEGLYLLTSVALALSVMRLAKRNTVVHEMSCIETLARIDVLCVDKTGTITEPQMQVSQVICLDERLGEDFVTELLWQYHRVLEADNETAMAIRRYYAERGADSELENGAGKERDWDAIRAIPFQSKTKWSAVVFKDRGAYVMGAPEVLLGEQYPKLSRELVEYAKRGERVILAASFDGNPEEGKALTGVIHPLAFFVIANNIRENAEATFRFFEEQGVSVKVISGDHPAAVAKIAAQAGITGAEQFADARKFETEAELLKAVETYTVFGRVTPEQKRQIVKALKQNGHTVAMTGDGVNDILALKDADCSVAMASGSEAACHAAHLVLMDSDFSAMPEIVAEGRRVINNIERAAALFLVKNIFSFVLTVILLFAPLTYPLTPIQLTMIGGFTIGIPSFFLALEPGADRIRGRFILNVMDKALPGGLTNVLAVLAVSIVCEAMGYPVEVMNTMAGIAVGFVGLLVLAGVCQPFDKKRFFLWFMMAALLIANILLLGRQLYSLVPLQFTQMIILFAIMGASGPCLLFMRRGIDAAALYWRGKREGACVRKQNRKRTIF
ncbi:MAG: HAD-IC family P-type ATPase [Lachnospiraceae bacterium]|nr:HAD-IC family P-type ATPase [Lachnospiraceae bacterium]